VLLHVLQFVEVETVISCTYTAAWFVSVAGRYCTCVVGRLLFNADICGRSRHRKHCNTIYQVGVCIQHIHTSWNYEIQEAKILQLVKIWAFELTSGEGLNTVKIIILYSLQF